MASSGKESFKQDLVVSIRYRNELPPPPMPPKFLDIDTGGISQYLTTSYASSLARREDPNIDVDAEGGMPIDMIGIPGYFLGDESAIMAPDTQPLLDPADQALLLSLDQLKSQGARNNVSFLRKNQYLSSQNNRTGDRLLGTPRVQKAINKAASMADRNDKENIKRHIQKGFDTAYPDSIPYNPPEAKSQTSTPQEREAWKQPRHPDNARLKPVAIYPVLPDFETGTDVGSWGRVKFDKPPLPARHGKRDDRIDSALFNALRNTAAAEQWQAAKEAFESNPKAYDDPGPIPPHNYVMLLPENPDHNSRIRKVLYAGHPEQDPSIREEISEETEDGTLRIPFARVRAYPSVQQSETAPNRFMALGLYDPDSPSNAVAPSKTKSTQGPAAYFYPIAENIRFRTDRSKISKPSQPEEEDEEHVDRLLVGTVEPNPYQISERTVFRGKNDDKFKSEWEVLDREGVKWNKAQERELEGEQPRDVDMGGDDDRRENGTKVNGNGVSRIEAWEEGVRRASMDEGDGEEGERGGDAMDDD